MILDQGDLLGQEQLVKINKLNILLQSARMTAEISCRQAEPLGRSSGSRTGILPQPSSQELQWITCGFTSLILKATQDQTNGNESKHRRVCPAEAKAKVTAAVLQGHPKDFCLLTFWGAETKNGNIR